MKAHRFFGSSRIYLILILLLGGVTVSAVTFSDSLRKQIGSRVEGTFAESLFRTSSNKTFAVTDATVTTDKQDYLPGEIVQISGSGFRPNEPVTLLVVHIEPLSIRLDASSVTDYDHAGHTPWDVMVGPDGTFTSSWLVQEDSLNQTLLLTADQLATDSLPAVHAETTFTDSSVPIYNQCSNDLGTGYGGGGVNSGCRWINGNLNRNNSFYPEGDATVQRAWLDGFAPNTTHTVTFQYGTTKNGAHAYDFLTRWDWSENWISVTDRCELITGCNSAAEVAAAIPNDPNLVDSVENAELGTKPPREFVMRGGTFAGPTPISVPTIESGTYAGTSETIITVTFTTGGVGSAMCNTTNQGVTNCGVAIWFGAHVARTDHWNAAFPGQTGAGGISGSPYHVALLAVDGESVGQRDNQMQANATSRQSIEVRKELVPENDEGRFNLNIDPTTLTAYTQPNVGDGGTTGPQQVTTGLHVVSETGGNTPPTSLTDYTTNLTCVTIPRNGNPQNPVNYGSVTQGTVDVDPGDEIICTFTNTRKSRIITIKQTLPDGDPQLFDFDASWDAGAPPDFQLSDGQQNDSGPLNPGTYSVAETVPIGWDQTSATCTSTEQGDLSTPASIDLDAGEIVTCTFTNTKRGRIIVDKVTNPSGDPQSFSFTTTGSGYSGFSLTDAAAPNNQQVVPGNYSVSETVPAGWDLTNTVCSDGSLVSNINVSPGETVTCTFTNTKRGRIIVDKVTNPSGDTQSFSFTTTGAGYNGFSLTDTAPPNSQEVLPGSYTVAETVPAGWDLTSATCNLGEEPNSIDVGPGETVTCTFTNTKRGRIVVDKVTVPSGDTQSFSFTTTGTGYSGFSLTDGAAPNSQEVVPGAYSVAETPVGGWDLTSATCDQGETTESLDVEPGETVTCVFTNTKRGSITIVKDAVPDDAQDFAYTATESTDTTIPDFSLDDDSDGSLPNSRTFNNLKPGTYSVTETLPVPGWDFTNLQCSAGGAPSGSTANITLPAGGSVTCTFKNTKKATVLLVKNTTGGDATFDYATSGTLVGGGIPVVTNPVSVTTSGGTGQSALYTFSNLPAAGSSLVFDELLPAGWSFVSVGVTGDGGHSVVGDVATLDVDPGETIVVTYANSKPDMYITITPGTDVNPVGQEHEFLVTVTQIPNGATPATTVDVTPSVTPAPNSQSSTCGVGVLFTGNVATCTITINSPTAGVFTANASATAVIGGVSITRATDGTPGPGGSGPATKRYVDAAIALDPLSDTNPVGLDHVITATVTQNDGLPAGAPGDGVTGFGPAPDNTLVTFSLTNSNGSTANFVGGNTCLTSGGTGQCSVTINSPTAGTVTINATTTFDVGGVSLTRATNGTPGPGGTGPVTKVYVDAKIEIDPLVDTNPVNEPHTFTAIVRQDDGIAAPGGDGVSGWAPAPDGTTVVFSFVTNTIGAGFVGGDNDCTTLAGICTVQINSSAPGTVVVQATTTFTVGGQSLTRTTGSGGNNSANAQKTYEAGVIIVDKVTDPAGDPQLFTFDSSWTADFQLADQTAPHNSGYLPPGPYSVSELAQGGWDLTSATCTSTEAGDLSTPGSIDLDAGETVTCVFNNQKDANIIVVKQTDPDGDPADFTFTATYDANGFTLSDGEQNDSGDLNPGTYSVSENALAGWDLTSATCTSTEVGDLSTPASIDLDAGETVTCTFNNQKDAVIIVDKVTVPANDTQQFNFNPSWTTDFQLADQTAPHNSGDLNPGTYSVSEDVPAGWDQTSATCSDGSDPGSIQLTAGETVTCTFTNTKRGKVLVDKVTIPADDPQSFDFTSSFGPFALTDDSALFDSGAVVPGTYSVSETGETGWDLTSATCDDGSPVNAIEVGAGETVTCTFTNTKEGRIEIEKQTLPNGSTQSFGFTGQIVTSLSDGQDAGTGVDPGAYSVSEAALAGWDLISISCSDTDSSGNLATRTANFIVSPGETVRCVFTNRQRGTIIVEKQTDPDGAPGTFTFSGTAAGSISDNGTITVGNLVPGTYTSTEGDPTPNFDLTSIVCDDATSGSASTGNVGTLTATFRLDPGETVKCTFTNRQRGLARVVKTVNGQTPASGQSFTFQLREGASTSSDGTIHETKSTDAAGNISFTTTLIPGQTYQICEQVFPGWNTNLAGDGPLFVPSSIIPPSLPNPNVNNLTVCADFTVTAGQTRTFTVDNTPPPGGRALTIGFWKNWASCSRSNGGQKAFLDLALGKASALTAPTTIPPVAPDKPGGLVVSAQNPGSGWPNYAATWYLVLKGNPLSTEDNILTAADCEKAVNLLNKSTMDGRKKMASDPLFNMTAQLIAAELNRFMGAGINGVTITNIDKAVLLNGKYKFNGNTYSPKLSAVDSTYANCLAKELDNYNNNRPVSSCTSP